MYSMYSISLELGFNALENQKIPLKKHLWLTNSKKALKIISFKKCPHYNELKINPHKFTYKRNVIFNKITDNIYSLDFGQYLF